MSVVVWKKFVLKETFKRSSPPHTDSTAKELTIFDEPNENTVALITRAESNNGIRGYIEKGNFPTLLKGITYNDQFSLFLFHNYEFTTIKDHLSIVTATNDKLQSIMNENNNVSKFIATILNHIFSKKIFNFNFTGADYRYDREIVLLPCIEINNDSDYIWKENGHYYTLAIDYIESVMTQAQEIKEEKTIRLYEAKKIKYEIERENYKNSYLEEKGKILWKSFRLDELFSFDSGNQLSTNKKALDVSDIKDADHPIALITQSEKNNGVSGYLELNEEIESKKMSNYLTYSMHFGLCFFHDYDFVLMDTHGSVFRLIAKNDKMKEVMNNKQEVNLFLAKIITDVCRNGIYNYSWLPNSTRVGREIILLPSIEVNSQDDYIWEERGHYYKLAINYISYAFLSGRINYYQKLINNYEYNY